MNISKALIYTCLALCSVCRAADYNVAVRAHKGIDIAKGQWQATIDSLNTQLPQHSFQLIPVLDLNELSNQAQRGTIDFVLTNPSSFVEMQQLYDAKALATLNNKRANTAQSQFGSVIFTHILNADIVTLKDLKDRSFMAVSEPAFGGWRVGWLEMLSHNIDPYKDLKPLSFAKGKTQPEVVHAVLNQTVDAGIVRTDLLERLEALGQIDMRYLRVLNNKDVPGFPFFLSTKLYPEWAFASLKHIPANDSMAVSNALFTITKENPAAIKGKYISWIKPKSYQSVKELMQKLNVGPYHDK